VERRKASARRFARAVPVRHGGWTTRLPAFRFPFLFFVIASEAKQSSAAVRFLDCFVASLLAMTTERLGCLTKLGRKRAARTENHYLVIAGLDPAIHAAKPLALASPRGFGLLNVSMGHRVKPGGDERENVETHRAL
jgi:hypothetical protein